MHNAEDRDILAKRLAATGLKDKALVALLGVSQSTVSRLRHRKIANVKRYLRILDADSSDINEDEGAINRYANELALHAKTDTELRKLLISLHKIMHRI